MIAAESSTPRGGWALIVNALAELGARELERRAKAQQADEPRRDDTQAQPDDQAHDAEPTEAAA